MDFIEYSEYYSMLIKPFYAPPDWLFGIAWGIIYPLIAIYALCLIFSFVKNKDFKKDIIWIFVINMVFNYLFTPVTLIARNVWVSLVMILLVFISLVWLYCKSRKYSLKITLLILPYLVWVSFATILSVHIALIN
jgi:benzodiazapine receptor